MSDPNVIDINRRELENLNERMSAGEELTPDELCTYMFAVAAGHFELYPGEFADFTADKDLEAP